MAAPALRRPMSPREDEAESVIDADESISGTLASQAVMMLVFPVFEWDDTLLFEDDPRDVDAALDHDLAAMLPPATVRRGEMEVCPVLEEALTGVAEAAAGPGASGPRSPVVPPPSIHISMPPTPHGTHRNMWRSREDSVLSDSCASTVIAVAANMQTAEPDGLDNSNVMDVDQLGYASAIHSPRSVASLAIISPIVTPRRIVQSPGSSQRSPGSIQRSPGSFSVAESRDVVDVRRSLDDTAGTSSVYALNDSSGSHTPLFSDSLQLDFRQLVALGQKPTRQCLSAEEARTLPRVRFDAAEKQRCSICLESFKHGMLLTKLHCGHVFHLDCLSEWVGRAAHCPNCREQIEP
eukprot:gnl/TRDRNA2_/TRDRNA2_192760_c0_seq1.p1 gnl/TRDRNA2_/TRDRNA2_192760_c0~~gnl/TRDRNA2_/TRDRNA2_192760_c0_seq1.p1  ORF type:complete len:351 (-),score=40.32 gnl/TRDRNA2_/TRDRNA2_192760_c0_seq1:41-1093(-)